MKRYEGHLFAVIFSGVMDIGALVDILMILTVPPSLEMVSRMRGKCRWWMSHPPLFQQADHGFIAFRTGQAKSRSVLLISSRFPANTS
ncbi:MAG: hypothetical protein ACLRPT_01260 [Akkermansia muciniphila]